ncbi:FtsK/SpoIIIE domain-containing protein [Streptomyces sp. NPDC051561]|uniref:FtsK/SpoIIIE domain-containing protein n=1 Tax=Streptomyces sp. NPDC051561 TaxID=3365658 RepID=UPI003790EF85
MNWIAVVWVASALLCVGLLTQWWWEPSAKRWFGRRQGGPWAWYLLGFPLALCRVRWSWRRLCQHLDLAVSHRPKYAAIGRHSMIRSTAIRPIPPRLGLLRVSSLGFSVRVRLHPGQTPLEFLVAAEAFAHAWRVHSVRVISPQRGEILIIATARDPFEESETWRRFPAPRLLAAVVGRLADGAAWVIDLRKIPHWLITGATQSGKSTLLAALVTELGSQRIALVGIDCKGGMELGLFSRRLSALATNRQEAIELLSALITELKDRTFQCRAAGVRSIWDLDDDERPTPIVVVVDEIAELFLAGASLSDRKESVECSNLLLRIAQLGAALGIYLIVSAQRFGSDLGPGATALRAQLGGRVCHRVNDEATAQMTLGDLAPDAVAVAQLITETEQGVAVTTSGGAWIRARSHLITPDQAREYSERNRDQAPWLNALNRRPTREAESG